MSRQANVTLTALAQQGDSMPDIPIRHMKLNHRTREVILGRASLKEPRPNKDGSKNINEVSRIARRDNGYMSRNETIASEHAALLLMQDGEVCLEHRAGGFPPTFLNGNRVHELVTVQNNDIINLGPLAPYYSRSKERLYQPFALKMNLTFEHVLLSDDDNSSSSFDDDDDDVVSVHEAPSHQEHPDRLEMIRGHEVIEVSDEESEVSHEEHEDEDTLLRKTSQTIIIDLTENDVEQRADEVREQSPFLPHIAFAEYEDSSSGEEVDEDIDSNEIADLEDEMGSIDNDSIFADNNSNAPSEHPIDREPATQSFPLNVHLDYGPDPDLFELDFDMNVIEDASEEDEDDVDYEPDFGQDQIHFVPKDLGDFQEAEEQRIREKELILENATKIHDAMTQEQQQQDAKLRTALVESNKIKNLQQQQQKQRQADLLVSFESEQRIVRETSQKMADRKAQEVEKIELARQHHLAKEINEKTFEGLVAKANTPPQEPVVALQRRNETTTEFHQEGVVTHEEYMPPIAKPHSSAREDFYSDEAFHFCPVDAQNLGPVPMQCNRTVHNAAELPPYHSESIIQPPHHSFDEFASRHDKSTRKMAKELVHGQQPPPPTLLMSSSLFGQPMEAGMTLPLPNPKQKEDPYTRFRAARLPDSQECAQKHLTVFADQHSFWKARQNGKVSIDDLVDHDEENEDCSDKESSDADVKRALAIANGMLGHETQKVEKNDPRFFMLHHLSAPTPVPSTPEFAYWKEKQKETTKEPSSSPPVTNSVDLTDKVDEDKSSQSSPSIQSKKRKHVDFEEHDTIISSASEEAQESYTSTPTDFDGVPIGSAHCNVRDIFMASISSEFEAECTSTATSAVIGPADKHVHFASPVETEQSTIIKKRQIAVPTGPNKRLKMMKNAAEKAAYVLAGAAVASVGVFAALVSTAPEDF